VSLSIGSDTPAPVPSAGQKPAGLETHGSRVAHSPDLPTSPLVRDLGLTVNRFVYAADTVGGIAAFESMVLDQAPPGAVVVGASLSPDGRHGAVLTFLPGANYLMDDVFDRDGDRWQLNRGGSGGGIAWSVLGEGDRGVLRFGGQAPEDASGAWVRYEGAEYRVPVRFGHFLFVAWDTAFPEDHPALIRFE
jgi:hypothetical protein